MIGASLIVLLFAYNGADVSAWQHLSMSAVLPTTPTKTTSASRRVSPPPRTKAELKEEFFTADNGLVKFGSLQVSPKCPCSGASPSLTTHILSCSCFSDCRSEHPWSLCRELEELSAHRSNAHHLCLLGQEEFGEARGWPLPHFLEGPKGTYSANS